MEDRERLKHLIDHWLEHNEGHMKTYAEWAGRARALEIEGLQAALDEVAEETGKAGALLKKARALLG